MFSNVEQQRCFVYTLIYGEKIQYTCRLGHYMTVFTRKVCHGYKEPFGGTLLLFKNLKGSQGGTAKQAFGKASKTNQSRGMFCSDSSFEQTRNFSMFTNKKMT